MRLRKYLFTYLFHKTGKFCAGKIQTKCEDDRKPTHHHSETICGGGGCLFRITPKSLVDVFCDRFYCGDYLASLLEVSPASY